MKKIILVLFFTSSTLFMFGTVFTVTNVGFTFSPATLTINQGDEVTFSVASIHDAVEVSLETWNAEGISPIIGFSVPFGGGTVPASMLPVGTHYYVCENHASMGMKGIIIVQSSSGIFDHKVQDSILLYPNPVKDNLSVQIDPPTVKVIEIKLYDFQGKLVNVLLSKTEISGFYKHSFSLNNKTRPGIYFVQILSDDVTTYRKVIVQ